VITKYKKALARRSIGHNLGYGVGDDMDVLLAELVPPFQPKGVGG
jgi:hypothetical protein